MKKESKVINKLLADKKEKERIHFLLGKCFENAYTNIGNIAKSINLGEEQVTFFFKYDERFSTYKRKWYEKIRAELAEKISDEEALEKEYNDNVKELDLIIFPQPFSKAISNFSYCISQIGRDKFSYIIEADYFPREAQGKSPEKFIKQHVVKLAKKYLSQMNQKFKKKFPFLKSLVKNSLDANYYIFYFKKSDFTSFADQEAIPPAFKKILVRDILDSDFADRHIASQLVYVKQVINSLTLSGLLFTKSSEEQKAIKGIEKKLSKKIQIQFGLNLNSIYEIAHLGNKKEDVINIAYTLIYKKKVTKKNVNYKLVKKMITTIIKNAKELIATFDKLQK